MLFVVAPLLVVRMVSAPCVSSLPPNIDAGMLQPTVIGLLQQSPTFQQQCARLAASRVLRVAVRVGTAVDAGAMAVTVISRYDAGAIRAEVTLRFAETTCCCSRTSSSTSSSRWKAWTCATRRRPGAPGEPRAAPGRRAAHSMPGSGSARKPTRCPGIRSTDRRAPYRFSASFSCCTIVA